MKIIFLIAVWLLPLLGRGQGGRLTIPFDEGWSYVCRDSVVTDVTLPRAWNERSAFAVSIADLPTDTVRYVKTFRLPREARGKRVLIEFEGVRQAARVWLNGHLLGLHENGITAFGFDLTPYIIYKGENRLEVLTDNHWDYREQATGTTFQWNNKNFNANYGGLWRRVRLHVLGDVYQTLPLYSSFGTTGVYVYAEDFDMEKGEATVVVESQVRNDSKKPRNVALHAVLSEAQGAGNHTFPVGSDVVAANTTKVLTTRLRLPLKFWAWREPNLYAVGTKLMVEGEMVDSLTTLTGFRKTYFGEGTIRLNDRLLMVHGFAQRTTNEWPGVGVDVPTWLSDYSNRLMTECGGNLVRWMHTMPSPQDVASCDRVGLLQAMPAGDAEKDVEGRQWKQRVEVMRDAIVYYRNNPSIIFYECGNKGISEPHMQEMKALRDEFDPHGGRAIGCREMLGKNSCAEYGGEMLYINKSAGKPVWAMEYCRDEGLRRYWDNWSWPYHQSGDGPLYRNEPALAYNHNQDQLAIEHVRRWYDYWQVRPGTGRRVSSGGVKIIFSDTNTHCRGESNYRTSGVVDAMRLPKDSFYAHQVMWNGWVEPEVPAIYVMGHWNYPAGTVKPIYIVSNTDSVRLLLNGQPLPIARREYHFLFVADSVAYQPGTLTALGYHAGKEVCRYELRTIGEPASLRLSAKTAEGGWVADGRDMALLEFEVVDSEGRRCPLDHRMVSFTVDGPAEWCGGIAAGRPDNYVGSLQLPVECGVNRALLRSTTQSGTICIMAQAEGLPVATLVLESKELSTARSYSTVSSSDPATPVSLAGSSAQNLAILPASVNAGVNAAEAQNACDDDEETEWKNDGRLSTAWMTFCFDKAESVDEISMKLTGWRRRSYPIEVLADDNTLLWSGNTPMSLGYVTLSLLPNHPTRSITVRLRGASTDSDAFGQVTELAQPVANELDLYKAKDGDKVRHELRIIECDFLRHCQ